MREVSTLLAELQQAVDYYLAMLNSARRIKGGAGKMDPNSRHTQELYEAEDALRELRGLELCGPDLQLREGKQ